MDSVKFEVHFYRRSDRPDRQHAWRHSRRDRRHCRRIRRNAPTGHAAGSFFGVPAVLPPSRIPSCPPPAPAAPQLAVVEDEPTTTDDTKLVKDQDNVIEEAETPQESETPEVTDPASAAIDSRVAELRSTKRPAVTRPSGKGPMGRIVERLGPARNPHPLPEAAEPAKRRSPGRLGRGPVWAA